MCLAVSSLSRVLSHSNQYCERATQTEASLDESKHAVYRTFKFDSLSYQQKFKYNFLPRYVDLLSCVISIANILQIVFERRQQAA